MLQLIDKKNKLFLYIFLFFLFSTINNKSLVNSHIDYVVNDFLISGLSDKDNHKIANDLKTSLLQNIFFIDKKKFSKILYSNNLVHSFKAKKIYPNIIRVDIKKTDYFNTALDLSKISSSF